jgi:hypothetical protein
MEISNMEGCTDSNLKITDILLINGELPDNVSDKWY